MCIVVAACGSYGASPWRFSRCWGMFLPPIISSKLCLQHLSSFCRDIVGGWSHGLSPDCADVKLGSTIKRFNQTKKTISQYFLCLWRGLGVELMVGLIEDTCQVHYGKRSQLCFWKLTYGYKLVSLAISAM